MSKIRRSFTPEDRYSIVQEAIRDGHAETSRSIGFVTPQQKWEEAQVGYDTTFSENLSS